MVRDLRHTATTFFGQTNSMRMIFPTTYLPTSRLHGRGEGLCVRANQLDSKAIID
jgi:hypothetical protein